MIAPPRPTPVSGLSPAGLHDQRGFSLIELSIAILIALFLIGGVLVVEQGVHRSYQDDSGLAQLEDEERFAMTIITQAVESAGYYPDPTSNVPNSTVLMAESTSTGGVTIPFAGAQSIFGIYQSAAPNDSIAARFVAGPAASSDLCTGSATTSGVEYTTYLYVANGSDGKPYLYCALATAGVWASSPTSPVQLVSGIQNMTIMYGVNTTGSDNVQTYMFASDVTADGYWPNVSSVKVTLTLVNPIASEAGQKGTVQFTRVISVMGRMGGS